MRKIIAVVRMLTLVVVATSLFCTNILLQVMERALCISLKTRIIT